MFTKFATVKGGIIFFKEDGTVHFVEDENITEQEKALNEILSFHLEWARRVSEFIAESQPGDVK